MVLTRHMIAPLLFGLIGAAVLVGLGVWQLQRLEWKRDVLAQIDARIGMEPVALPAVPDPKSDKYLPVTLSGTLTGSEAHVLSSTRDDGPGYRVIAVMVTGSGRHILVDLGFVAEVELGTPRPTGPLAVVGNIHWPSEVDSFTPPPDPAQDLWFARDAVAMAKALGAEPFMVIARTVTPPVDSVTPLPVDSSGIANDHLEYAITWFSLALVWLGMTGLLLWRIRQRAV